ncbi:MAG: CBS domain-containing protein [Bacteroidota bacterium]
MGEHQLNTNTGKEARQNFIKHLLDDVEALDQILQENHIEKNICRIGAEQEFCLVNDHWRPCTKADTILSEIEDPHFTTELAKYNLEINLDPFELKGNALQLIERQLADLLTKAQKTASAHGSNVVLSGILPSISTREVELDYMTEKPRYFAINDMFRRLKKSDFTIQLFGIDELSIKHDSMMFEACNTSFQMHLQINPDHFASIYNWAQTIAAPVLGIAVNSPLLLGKELWQESRIALFQQSIDIRETPYAVKEQQARVSFGDDWAEGSIADFYRSEISKYRIILSKEIEESALSQLQKGITPKLEALSLLNGTIYKWNRPCYGVHNNVPHVRIENRYVPAGPSILDEMANFAFWTGLMVGQPEEYQNLATTVDFRDIKMNFIKTARNGAEAVLNWMGSEVPVRDLIKEKLLPIAREGLEKEDIDKKDIDRLLGVIEKRTEKKTAAKWMIESYRNLKKEVRQDHALVTLTKSIHELQQSNDPIHDWPVVKQSTIDPLKATEVGQIMSTKLLTTFMDDTAELTLQVMEWRNIHHVPVVDHHEQLVGLLTWTHLKKFREQHPSEHSDEPVSQIMVKNVKTAHNHMLIAEAISIMKKYEYGCLPVVQKDHLVGIITIKDVRPFDNG